MNRYGLIFALDIAKRTGVIIDSNQQDISFSDDNIQNVCLGDIVSFDIESESWGLCATKVKPIYRLLLQDA